MHKQRERIKEKQCLHFVFGLIGNIKNWADAHLRLI